MAKKHGVSIQTIYRQLEKHPQHKKPKRRDRTQIINPTELLRDYQTMSPTELTEKYGASESTIFRHLKRIGYTKRHQKLPSVDVLLNEYKTMSLTQLGKKYGVTHHAVGQVLRKHPDYKPRPKGRIKTKKTASRKTKAPAKSPPKRTKISYAPTTTLNDGSGDKVINMRTALPVTKKTRGRPKKTTALAIQLARVLAVNQRGVRYAVNK